MTAARGLPAGLPGEEHFVDILDAEELKMLQRCTHKIAAELSARLGQPPTR